MLFLVIISCSKSCKTIFASIGDKEFRIENVLTKVTNSEKIHSTHNINIAPDGFNEIFNICNTNEKWLKNLSNIMIPEKAKIVLQLGQHFNLPNNMVNKNNITQEFIKHVEYSLFKADDETRNYVRNESIRIMKSIKKCDIKSFENIVLQEGVGEVKRFISENPELFITRADKGNTTVIMCRNSYKEKMFENLNDRTTYELMKNDPTNKITAGIVNLLKFWKNKGYIDSSLYKKLHVAV